MSNKFFRIPIAILITVSTVFFTCICIQGIISTEESQYTSRFIECIVRCVVFLIFSIFYYLSFSRGIGSETLLFPIYILASLVTEIRILSDFSAATGVFLLNTMTGVTIELFSTLMVCFSLIGYGIIYLKNENTFSGSYITLCLVASFLISVRIPKIADYYAIWKQPYIVVLFSVIFAVLILIAIILLITDTSGSNRFRHIATLLLITGNAMNLAFNTLVMNSIATVFSTCGLLFIILVAQKNDIKL